MAADGGNGDGGGGGGNKINHCVVAYILMANTYGGDAVKHCVAACV